YQRQRQGRQHGGQRAEHHARRYLDHTSVLPFLVNRRIYQSLWQYLRDFLRTTATPRPRRFLLDRIRREDRRLVSGILVGSQQIHEPAASSRLAVTNQLVNLVLGPFARHY